MNLDHIKLFVAVYNAGSFAAVAKELDVAPSSVSRAIASLEDHLKTRLFQRTTRNLTPTQSGAFYYQRVEALVEELEIAQQELIAQNSEPFGRLRITASTSFGQTILVPYLKSFQKLYPKVSIELILSDTQANLVDGQYDVAVRHGKLNDSNLISRKLMTVRYVLVAGTEYVNRNTPIKNPSDIKKHALISFGYKNFNKEWRFHDGDLEERISIEPLMTITTASAIKECVLKNMGVAILPDWIIEEELKTLQLVNVLPNWQVTGTESDTAIWLLYPTRLFVAAKTTAFVNHLLENH